MENPRPGLGCKEGNCGEDAYELLVERRELAVIECGEGSNDTLYRVKPLDALMKSEKAPIKELRNHVHMPQSNLILRIFAVSAFLGSGWAALGGPSPSPVAAIGAQLENLAQLQTGDRLTFQILEDGDPPIELEVNGEGMINVPYLGEIPVKGLTEKSLSVLVKAKLDKELYNSATVRIYLRDRSGKPSARGRIFISGQVRRVGMVEIDNGEANTVGKVILTNGGLSDFADARKIKIFRMDSAGTVQSQIVDLHEVLEKGRLDLDVPLFDGDLVVVGSKLVNW